MKRLFEYVGYAIATVLLLFFINDMNLYAREDAVDASSFKFKLNDDVKYESHASIMDSYGDTHNGQIFTFFDDSTMQFFFEGKAKEFNCLIFCQPEYEGEGYINIYADGVLIYKYYEIKDISRPKEISLDVQGVNCLEFYYETMGGGYLSTDQEIYIADATVILSDTPHSYYEFSHLNERFIVSNEGMNYDNVSVFDNNGKLQTNSLQFIAGSNSEAKSLIYRLNGEYERLTAEIFLDDYPYYWEKTDKVELYADDKLVYSQSFAGKDYKVYKIDVSVENCDVLKIVYDHKATSNGDLMDLYFCEGLLSKHAHKEDSIVYEKYATCTEKGSAYRNCLICGKRAIEFEIDALGHDIPEEWEIVEEEGCTIDGKRVKKCKTCKEVIKEESIAAKGHKSDGNWVEENDNSCVLVVYCAVCGDVSERQEESDVIHTPSAEYIIQTPATCDRDGSEATLCTKCGSILEERSIDKTSHEMGKWQKKSGNIFNMPIVKERECDNCSYSEVKNDNSLAWVMPVICIAVVAVIASVCIWINKKKKNKANHGTQDVLYKDDQLSSK